MSSIKLIHRMGKETDQRSNKRENNNQCIRCGKSEDIRKLKRGDTKIGPFDRLCAYERKYSNIPVYMNYPQNSKEFRYRLVLQKNIPNNPELVSLVNRRVIFFMIYSLLAIGIIFQLIIFLLDYLFLSSIILFFYFFVTIFVVILEMTDNNWISENISDLYGLLKGKERFYIENSVFRFHGSLFGMMLINILLFPAFISLLALYGMLLLLVPIMVFILGPFLLPISLFSVIYLFKNPKVFGKTILNILIIKPSKYVKIRLTTMIRIYFNGLLLNRNQGWDHLSTFEKTWAKNTDINLSPSSLNLFILLVNFPIHVLVGLVTISFQQGRYLLLLFYWIIEDMLELIGIEIFTFQPKPIHDIIGQVLFAIFFILLVLRGMEYINNQITKKYNSIITNHKLPEDVEKLKKLDNRKIYPRPTKLEKTGYSKEYWL